MRQARAFVTATGDGEPDVIWYRHPDLTEKEKLNVRIRSGIEFADSGQGSYVCLESLRFYFPDRTCELGLE